MNTIRNFILSGIFVILLFPSTLLASAIVAIRMVLGLG